MSEAHSEGSTHSSRPWRRWLGWLWLIASPVLFVIYIQRSELFRARELHAALRTLRPWPLVAAVALHLVLVLSKGRRLALLLHGRGDRPLRTVWLTALYLGSYAMDNLLFSQAGVGSRVLLLQRAGVPLLVAVGSQLLDKVLEAAGLVLLLPLALPGLRRLPLWTSLHSWLGRLLLLGPTSTTALAVRVALLVAGLSLLWGLGRLVVRALRRSTAVEDTLRLASRLRQPPVLIEVLLLTAVGWALELAMLMLVIVAVGGVPRLGPSALTLVLVNLAMLLPGLPANIGPFEAAAVLGLQAHGLPPAPALLGALVYHAMHTVPVTLLGLPLWRWLGLTERPTPGARAPGEATG